MSANLNITDRLSALSPAKRALLELKLAQKKAVRRAQPIIQHTPNRTLAPLSYNQQGMWVLSRFMPGSSIYHTPIAVRLRGMLDIDVLRKALNAIVARHAGLRTTFDLIDGTPMQIIAEELSLDVPLIDLCDLSQPVREARARRLLSEEARRPFDLSAGPLIRAMLLRTAEQNHILLVTMHHIVTDGWSVGVFHEELSSLYEAFAAGRPSPLPELPIQYADYADWQRVSLFGEMYEAQLAYWKKQFASPPPVLELPTDNPRTNAQAYCEFRGAQHTIALPTKLTSDLKQLCQKENVTLFMLLLSAYLILLHRYTAEEDIVVGTPIAGRNLPETDGLIGLFINTLALRANLANYPTCRELLARVKEVSLGAYAHQDVPFEHVVKQAQPERAPTHNPLFQAMFVLQSEEIPSLRLPGLSVEHFRVGNTMANFDLTLDIVERDDRLVCLFESNADLFEPTTIQQMMLHFQTLLESIIKHPDQNISKLAMLTDEERRQLLIEWNDTERDYPADKTLSELFEAQVANSPNSIAIACDHTTLTYAELNSRANQLAHYLRTRGVGVESPVGICLERSPEMIVAILGILKAGAFYVPLDPCYPEARLEFMLQDAGVRMLLTSSELANHFSTSDVEIVCLDRARSEVAQQDGTNPPPITTSENLAYVMYTSGSTGTPKGVCATHRNIVRLVTNTNYTRFSADEVFLQFAPITFDASTFEIFGSLLNGARLALMPAEKASLKDLGDAITKFNVTTLWLTTGLFPLMVDNHLHDLRGLRYLLVGGDVLSVAHAERFLRELDDCRLINCYGPTENTTFTTCYPVTRSSDLSRSAPIGRPISNTTTYILDRHLSPVPIGVAGELYTGGDGLARGYLNRPDLTAERFLPDPFSDRPNARLYKTGDLVRYRLNGDIEFLGRIDNQVKVRGFRIEPAEIEKTLMEHPSIQVAAVVARKDTADKHLVAYIVPNRDRLDEEELRTFLRERLPDYMVPSFFVELESLPLSSSGKVDRRALPANGFKPKAVAAFTAPADEIELKLAKIWEEVLGVRPVGINDNFFELGGHSLLAVRLFAQIEKSFGKNLPLAMLFQAPTIKQLARVLREQGLPATWSSLVMIQSGGDRLPFFCVHAAGGNVLEYHDLSRHLGSEQPFYGLQANGLDGKSEPHTTIREMAAHYIREIRDVQPDGPYLLGGRSSGGTIAFEMACQLAAEGQQVALLALLDTYPAGYFKLLQTSRGAARRTKRWAKKLESHLRNLWQLSLPEQIDYVRNKLSYAPAKLKHKLYRRGYKIYRRLGRPLPPVLRNIEELNFSAVKDYTPRVYEGDVTLFLASDLTADYDLHDGWRELVTGQIEVREIPGNHINIIKEPHVGALAKELSTCLEQAQSKVTAHACAA